MIGFDTERFSAEHLASLPKELPLQRDEIIYRDLNELLDHNVDAKYYMASGYLDMVDFVYEKLLLAGRLGQHAGDIYEKSVYWKEALREYKEVGKYTYRNIPLFEENFLLQLIEEQGFLIVPYHTPPSFPKTIRCRRN